MIALSRSVFLKFLGLQAPVFLLVLAVGLHMLASYRIQRGQEEMGARIGSSAGRVAGLISRLDLDSEAGHANQLVSLLMSDRGIACVELYADGKPDPRVSAPRLVGCKGAAASQFTMIPVEGAFELRVGLSTSEIDQIRNEARDFNLLIAAASLLLSSIAAGFAFRAVILKPLKRLLAAIHGTAETGQFTSVEVRTADEIGIVASSFNSMQASLDTERRRVAASLRKIDGLYNTTPALLFTIDSQGIIASVSDYWLAAAGYRRDKVIGQPFSRYLTDASAAVFTDDLLPRLVAGEPLREAPVDLLCADGGQADMLLSAVAGTEDRAGEGGTFVCIMSDVTMLRTVERQLRDLALTDYLTKLPNRFGMSERMMQLAQMHTNARGLVAVMLIDLDNFKWVNDTYGHDAGDLLLIEATRRICRAVRPGDMVARLGGDEFAIVCQRLDSQAQACQIASRVVDAFTAGIPLGDNIGYVSASIGIAFPAGSVLSADEILRHADQAMYAAKLSGKGCFRVYSTSQREVEDEKSRQRRTIETGLDSGLFRLHFQPIVDVATLQVVGLEAFLRFKASHGDIGSVDGLIRVAEESGLMDKLGGWILREAATQFCQLPELATGDSFFLSINLSTRQLTRNFVETLREALDEYPELVGRLVLEINETAAIKRFDLVSEVLTAIRAFGVRIAIDDFGLGYSSLGTISRLPLDQIKLDRSLVQALESAPSSQENRQARALMHSAITLASELGITIIAEGVESDETLALLRDSRVNLAQGYLFSRPLPMIHMLEWLSLFGEARRHPALPGATPGTSQAA